MEPQLEGCGKKKKGKKFKPDAGASMEPQLEGCGKSKERLHAGGRSRPLQWSRNLRVAESSTKQTTRQRPGTLQWSRNLRVAESVGQGPIEARGARFNGAAT